MSRAHTRFASCFPLQYCNINDGDISVKIFPHLCLGCRGGVNSLFSSSSAASGPADINYCAVEGGGERIYVLTSSQPITVGTVRSAKYFIQSYRMDGLLSTF